MFAVNYRKLRKTPTSHGQKYNIEKYYSFNRKTELSFIKSAYSFFWFHFFKHRKVLFSMYNFNLELSCLSRKKFRVAYKKQTNKII